jgi:hypothetical protein
LFSLIGLIVTSYFTYKANVNAAAAKTASREASLTALEAKTTADTVNEETQGIRRAFQTRGLDL